ncbi:MAG: GTPase ObgE [Deltaproteobacteria bacterium]|nr:GTPase ObgE [Deltaproteobacteria bacterium]
MHFVDEIRLHVKAGDGGRGCVAFLREKYRPKGGPAGGNGGDGGSVIFRVDPQLSTLVDLTAHKHLRADAGENGRGKDQHGKNGAPLVIRVPQGTLVKDETSGELLADLNTPGVEVIVAKGGKGGKGNAFFATSTNRAPRFAQPGIPGEERTIVLELRLLADVGLVGFPNAGKSTLISTVSAARPRIADYPFTTLTPNLGVVRYSEEKSFVMADVPGLIEGAHEGHGLGIRFLRHLSRTSLLVHLLDISDPERDPLHDYDVINHELTCFGDELGGRKQILVITKIDLPTTRERFPEVLEAFARRGVDAFAISAATREGLKPLLDRIVQELELQRVQAAPQSAVPPTPRFEPIPWE